jgi:hypothetical protein
MPNVNHKSSEGNATNQKPGIVNSPMPQTENQEREFFNLQLDKDETTS